MSPEQSPTELSAKRSHSKRAIRPQYFSSPEGYSSSWLATRMALISGARAHPERPTSTVYKSAACCPDRVRDEREPQSAHRTASPPDRRSAFLECASGPKQTARRVLPSSHDC